MTKKFTIDNEIFNRFPDAQIGIVVLKGLDNAANSESVFHLRETEQRVREKFSETPMLELPELSEWRQAYKQMGVKKGTRVSVESLLKRVLKGNEIPSINPLVDFYNTVSMRFVFPCGGEDLDQTKGDIRLTLAAGDESFRQIGSDEEEAPEANEIVYKDDLGCLCRRWNWREADRTKLTEDTMNAVLVVESLTKRRKHELSEALNKLGLLGQLKLGAQVEMMILNKENPAMVI